MAEPEIKAEITFSDQSSMDVQSTVEQIINEIGGVTTPHIPLIKVLNRGGDEVWINANDIRYFKAHDQTKH
jgi:hypothetical protein